MDGLCDMYQTADRPFLLCDEDKILVYAEWPHKDRCRIK